MLLAFIVLYLVLGILIAIFTDAKDDMFIITAILYPIAFLIFMIYLLAELVRCAYSALEDVVKRLL